MGALLVVVIPMDEVICVKGVVSVDVVRSVVVVSMMVDGDDVAVDGGGRVFRLSVAPHSSSD